MLDQLEVRIRDIEVEPEFHDYVRQRVEARLGKFEPPIQHVSVRFEDINGPRGTPGHHCVITIQMRRHDNLVAQETAEHYREAFDKTMDVAVQNVNKALHKGKDKARRR